MMNHKRDFLKCLGVASCLVTALNAAPHVNEPMEFEQPDGSKVSTIVNGDEFYQRVEDLFGRTLTVDSTGWICYASLNSDSSEYIPGARYNSHVRSASSIETLHLELKQSAVAKKYAEMKKIYQSPELTRALVPVPVVGTKVGVTILIDFSDSPAQVPKEEVEAMINGTTGSTATNYFKTVSAGKLNYTTKVVGYYRAKKLKTYYDDPNYSRTSELLEEALDWLDAGGEPGFKFTDLTAPSKVLTAANFFYAGSSKIWAKGLWPHMSQYNWTGSTSGYRTSVYQITGLTTASKNIGTFCHENGHMLLKYPDLYPYTGNTDWVGVYDLMSGGGSGSTPMPPNPYFRAESGWLTYEDISTTKDATIEMTANDPTRAVKYRNPNDPSKFFVLEAIQKTGQYAKFAPGNGMICWKINTGGENTQSGNNNPLIAVAGGTGTGALMSNRSGVAFSSTTTPAATWPLGGSSSILLKNLSAAGSTMTFDIGNGGTVEKKCVLSIVADNGVVTTNPEGSAFPVGTKVALTAVPKNGYTFAGWSGYLSGMTNPASVVMDSNRTVTALFTKKPIDYLVMSSGTTVANIKGDTLFYDDGGPAEDYSEKYTGTLTLKPAVAGKKVQLEFLEFAIEDTSASEAGAESQIWDSLVVYNGADDKATRLGMWYGSKKPKNLISTASDGSLTVAFFSDEATVGKGWKAKVSLVSPSSLVDEESSARSLDFAIINGEMKLTLPTLGEYSLEIFTVNGRQLYSMNSSVATVGTNSVSVPLKGLASGVAVVRLQSSAGSVVRRVVIP